MARKKNNRRVVAARFSPEGEKHVLLMYIIRKTTERTPSTFNERAVEQPTKEVKQPENEEEEDRSLRMQ